jgi:hypothetical protein
MVALLKQSGPAPLPTAADCPRLLCVAEVVAHPQGGWTIAAPEDATRSTIRLYRGNWSTREAAECALQSLTWL